MPFYNGFFGPKDLPQEIVDKISAAVKEALADPELIESLAKATMYPDYMPQEEYKKALLDLDTSLYRAARAGGLIPTRVKK